MGFLVAFSALAVAAPVASQSSTEPGEEPPGVYDPYEGMDKSGRIPSIEKPADLPNPGRWRYIPEGRLKPGSVFQRFLVSSFVVPILFRNSDTGVGGGIGFTDIDLRSQRRREFGAVFLTYTSKGQQSYWALWRRWLHHREVATGGVLQEERSFIGVTGGYQKTLTRRFYGFGPDSRERDRIKYTDEVFQLDLHLEMAIPEPGASLVGTFGVRGEFHSLSTDDFDCDEVFSAQDPRCTRMPGAWDQIFVFKNCAPPDVTAGCIQNRDHEQLGVLTAGLRWDTRDSQRNPYGGFEVGALVDAPLIQGGGGVGARFTLEASAAVRVPGIFHRGGDAGEEHPPTDSLNFGFTTWLKAGDLPFTALPNLGGPETLRGYPAGRFRDDAAWHAVVEHRIWVIPRGFEITPTIRIERIGFATFVEAGTVGSDGIDLVKNEVKFSYGVGFRMLLERAAPFRVDFGFSSEGLNWSARFGYSF